jgi:hypothetical protein
MKTLRTLLLLERAKPMLRQKELIFTISAGIRHILNHICVCIIKYFIGRASYFKGSPIATFTIRTIILTKTKE